MNEGDIMNTIWVVLANARMSTIYSISENNFHFTLVKTLFHEESTLKNSDFSTDRPGHFLKNAKELRGSFEEKNQQKNISIDLFSRQICDELESGRTAIHPYKAIIIIAGPHFYGLICHHANRYIKKMIKYHLPKNYTNFSSEKLKKELENLLAHEFRLLLLEES